jgi:hypothetical protein
VCKCQTGQNPQIHLISSLLARTYMLGELGSTRYYYLCPNMHRLARGFDKDRRRLVTRKGASIRRVATAKDPWGGKEIRWLF